MIMHVKVNALDLKEGVIAHQVNCKGVMGAGIAKQIREKFPTVFDEYKTFCDENNNNKDLLLGKAQLIQTNKDDIYVCNLFGQNTYNVKTKQTNYLALNLALYKMLKQMEDLDIKNVAIPHKIGCDLGGGDWVIVKNMIEEVFKEHPIINCYICELPTNK